jgi:hypothetical protein
MYYNKRSMEPVPETSTEIWSCSNDDCKGWMRIAYAFETKPNCPLCSSHMVSGTKMLPMLANSNGDMKPLRKPQETEAEPDLEKEPLA